MQNYELIWARENAGLTQVQAAAKIGVHRSAFARWETGATPIPRVKWLKFLAAVDLAPTDIPLGLDDTTGELPDDDLSLAAYPTEYRVAYEKMYDAAQTQRREYAAARYDERNEDGSVSFEVRSTTGLRDAAQAFVDRFNVVGDLARKLGIPPLLNSAPKMIPPPPWLSDVSDLV